MRSILPLLMFQGEASSALDLYMSVFPDARIDAIERYSAEGPGPEGTVRLARFTIRDQAVMCIDSPAPHAFKFTPSFSFFVECESEEELRRFADRLKADGSEMMPPDNYGFSRLFTWIGDRFGVSWQLNLQ